MTIPKIEEIHATTQAVVDAKEAEREKLRQKEIEAALPGLKEKAAEQMREAAAAGRAYTMVRADDQFISPYQALYVLKEELKAAGYQASMGNDNRSVEIEWRMPEPDRLEIKLELAGQFRGKEKEIRALLQDSLSYYEQTCQAPEKQTLLSIIYKALFKHQP